MAKREQHNREAAEGWEKMTGKPPTEDERKIINDVNYKMDQFAHYPREATLMRHRKFLHHKEGCEYFHLVYGPLGSLTASMHILTDTGGYLPDAKDYYEGTVDNFGCLTQN